MGRSDAESAARGSAAAGRQSLNNLRGTPFKLILLGIGAMALILPVALRSAQIDAPELRAALEMMMTLFAFAGAWLLRTQFSSSRRLRDLQLVAGALVLGLTTLAVAALPAAFDLHNGAYFAAAQLSGRLFVGAMFVAAAFMPADWLVARRRHPLAIVAGLSVAGLLVAGLGGLAVGTHGQPNRLAVTDGHPVLVALVVTAAALLVYASVGFVQRQRVEGDRVAGVVALALILLAAARVGQHVFALNVLANCGGRCVFCGLNPGPFGGKRMLVAGHIKPWKDSTSAERMDLRNGLAACPSHDVAFDTGLLTVDASLQVQISQALAGAVRADPLARQSYGRPPLRDTILLPDKAQLPGSKYLDWHRTNIFAA